MPVGGESLIVGGYTITFDSLALGIFQGEEGYPAVRQRPKSKPIANTDRYAKTKIDSITHGVDYVFKGILEEYTKALAAGVLWPFATFGKQGQVGLLKFLSAKVLILTAIAGTTAAASPATLTANKAVYADDHEPELIYAPDLRVVPIMLDLLPYDTGAGVVGSFVMT